MIKEMYRLREAYDSVDMNGRIMDTSIWVGAQYILISSRDDPNPLYRGLAIRDGECYFHEMTLSMILKNKNFVEVYNT